MPQLAIVLFLATPRTAMAAVSSVTVVTVVSPSAIALSLPIQQKLMVAASIAAAVPQSAIALFLATPLIVITIPKVMVAAFINLVARQASAIASLLAILTQVIKESMSMVITSIVMVTT